MNTFTILIVKISWVFAEVKTNQIIYFKYVPYRLLQLYPKQAEKKKIDSKEKPATKDMFVRIATNLTTFTFREGGGQEPSLVTFHEAFWSCLQQAYMASEFKKKKKIHLLTPSLSPGLRRPVTCPQMDQVTRLYCQTKSPPGFEPRVRRDQFPTRDNEKRSPRNRHFIYILYLCSELGPGQDGCPGR